jgi:hypothetical protein
MNFSQMLESRKFSQNNALLERFDWQNSLLLDLKVINPRWKSQDSWKFFPSVKFANDYVTELMRVEGPII